MCGIYGFIGHNDKKIVERKLRLINYRGPNFSDIYAEDDMLFLGHNRLAIIDLDERSNQPFIYEHLVIVFNGEIYNFKEIKQTLKNKAYQFTTTSDTEVIAAAYLELGDKCLEMFNGMFSFVIYDKKKRIIFGARDRLGKKPFFYRKTSETFEFASQISPILKDSENQINWYNVQEYFFWGYNQDPNTPFKDINKLKAGHYFIYDIDRKKFADYCYWDINIKKFASSSMSFNESVEHLEQLLVESIKIRSISDVPLGVFLSGGIDSSIVAAIAQKNSNSTIKTFSIGFEENGYDESGHAHKIADYLHTNHHSFLCTKTEVQDFILNIENYIDEPLSDPSYMPTLLLSKNTSAKVTVALSGDGGDEFFLGYNRYKWASKASSLPIIFKKPLSFLLKKSSLYRYNLIGEGLSQNDEFDLYCKMVGNMKQTWLNLDYSYNSTKQFWHSSLPLVSRMGHFDRNTYLVGDINTKVDRATMRFSLETRAPLMDYRIVEFANTLPQQYMYTYTQQKRILKSVLYKYLPEEFFKRTKAGFAMPLKEWFRGDLKEYVMDTLTDNSLQSIPFLNSKKFKLMIDEHMAETANNSLEIWKTIVWLKLYEKFKRDNSI
jgi:asparagine synthase (glutamine-hydrolysing)